MSENDSLTVVLVDDSPSVVAHFRGLVDCIDGVEMLGTATDGVEAVVLLKSLQPDLVVMDIVMPRMDGLTALRALRAEHPRLRVAMLSSLAGSRSRAEQAFKLGAVQVLTKPFDESKLRALFSSEKAHKTSAG
ncbi:MAG: response regulator [Myxococcota bacterium]|nr:response regulator [Myxococcota bacterium]